jgi:hypothetical protein
MSAWLNFFINSGVLGMAFPRLVIPLQTVKEASRKILDLGQFYRILSRLDGGMESENRFASKKILTNNSGSG